MIGIPYNLNTKEDVLTCHSLALSGELDKTQLKQKLQNLLSDEKVWVFKEEVSESYVPSENEKVMVETDEAGNTKYVCYVLQDNPYARYLQMGFTKEELTNLIAQLEV
jgi:hypothetical protein